MLLRLDRHPGGQRHDADRSIYRFTGRTSTLASLFGLTAINTASIGVTASIVTNSDGSSSLSLVSNTAGAAGTLTVTSSIVDTSTSLGYTTAVTGANANLTVDGIGV